MSQKILYLCSKKTEYFPNNGPESFGVKLSEIILQEGFYKVNLGHIIFKNDIKFLPEDVSIEYSTKKVRAASKESIDKAKTSKKTIFSAKAGTVDNKQDFIALLTSSLSEYLKYEEEEKCFIVLKKGKYFFSPYSVSYTHLTLPTNREV